MRGTIVRSSHRGARGAALWLVGGFQTTNFFDLTHISAKIHCEMTRKSVGLQNYTAMLSIQTVVQITFFQMKMAEQ